MTSILHRIETGSGPDRELDAEVCAALYHFPLADPIAAPPLTSSVDAVLALIEARLPGANIGLLYDGAVYVGEIMAYPPFVGRHAEIPRALLAATWRALKENAE